jgi:hypothetical protein
MKIFFCVEIFIGLLIVRSAYQCLLFDIENRIWSCVKFIEKRYKNRVDIFGKKLGKEYTKVVASFSTKFRKLVQNT